MPYKDKEKQKQYKKEYNKIYREKHKEQKKEYSKDYYEKNKEKLKQRNKIYKQEYYQTPQGKKSNIIGKWKNRGLKETKEKMEELYEIYTTIKYCEACDIELTRSSKNCSTDICLDHCHTTGRFRLMLCRSCNHYDKWKEYFC
tara:strand:- start:50 stop:478 length:429 start_codon:yes stop_codon:yes gene_type:complete